MNAFQLLTFPIGILLFIWWSVKSIKELVISIKNKVEPSASCKTWCGSILMFLIIGLLQLFDFLATIKIF